MTRQQRLALICVALVLACVAAAAWAESRTDATAIAASPTLPSPRQPANDPPEPGGLIRATFAAGCFWCTESDFKSLKGVVSTTAGYTGGHIAHPNYTQVSAGGTGHVEAIEVLFDPTVITFETLLDHYWHNVDFFNDHGQFCDYGEQYRPVIFVRGRPQRMAAEASRARLQSRFQARVVVEILEAGAFYPAEDYHQDYDTKNPLKYCYYRWSCGRDARLAEIWKKAL